QSHLTRTLRGVMSRVILYMAMSLDGFITGPGDGKENPAGVGGMRLMEWLGGGGSEVSAWRPSDSQSQIVFDEMMSTGAVITGRPSVRRAPRQPQRARPGPGAGSTKSASSAL